MAKRPPSYKAADRFAVRLPERGGDGYPRLSPHRRGYGANWQKVRRQVLYECPVCPCGAPATEVDHRTPLARGGTHERHNLQALCKACHSHKTATEDGGFGRA